MPNKEQTLFAFAAAVALVIVANVRLPRIEPVPEVPVEEEARPYRTAATTPALAPDRTYPAGRDPFRAHDPWAESPPALLAIPPAVPWPRALPGGPPGAARGGGDRPLVPEQIGGDGGGKQ